MGGRPGLAGISRTLCYSDTDTPDAATIRRGVNHLIAAARNATMHRHNAAWRRNCIWEKDVDWVSSQTSAKQWPGIGWQLKHGDPIALTVPGCVKE